MLHALTSRPHARFALVLGGVVAASLLGCASHDDGATADSTSGSGAGVATGGDAGSSGGDGGASTGGSGGTDTGGSTTGGSASTGGTSTGGSASTGGGGTNTGGGATGGSGGTAPTLGHVDLVPYYEAGSAWESNPTARAMVDTIFAEVEAALRTSGAWDATIEVYLTDDNTTTANTYFDTPFSKATVNGQIVSVVGTWAEIVLGAADANGPADTAGNGFDFAVSFNVQKHASNAGLLRHEIMHGLGAVNAAPNPTMASADNTLGGLIPGSWVGASVYDLALVDRKGKPLLGNYDSTTHKFQVLPYDIEPTYGEWTDGAAGLSFRGVADAGGNYDMLLGTTPDGADALLLLNEPDKLMSASAHPSWNHVAEPDRAFFRAMGYELNQ